MKKLIMLILAAVLMVPAVQAEKKQLEKALKKEYKAKSIFRCIDHKNSEHEMLTFFIINESAATHARIRAMENALKESEAAQRYAQKVSDFVKEGFATD